MAYFEDFIKNPLKYANDMPIKKLEKYLRKLSALYYNTPKSPVSDEIFDHLKEILKKRDPDNSFLEEVGAPVYRDKVKLPYPMGSLDKVKPDTGALEKWINKYKGEYLLSDKLDGISAMLNKHNNKVVFYSRGDGIFGQNITHLLKYIKIDTSMMPDDSAVRGELIMSRKNFKKISDTMENARNATAGVVNSKTVDSKVARLVEFIAYNIVHPRYKQSEQYEYLQKWGFKVVSHKTEKTVTEKKLLEYFTKRREESEYDIDGIVIMDNSKVHTITEGNPKYGVAFKAIMNDQYAIATVADVEWDVSRYNYIKPRIRIEPVKLVGVTITYATAHNAKFIYDNNIGIGAKIKIIRSGDVIPKIMEVISPSKDGKPKMPSIKYEWNETGVDIIAIDDNKEQTENIKIKKLTNMMETLGVKYINIGLITKLVESGYNSLAKILRADRDKISDIIGDKMTSKIYTNLEFALRNTQLHILMSASNIFGRGLGSKKLQLIIKKYPNIMSEKWSDETLYKKIILVDGFQDKTTEKFVDGFKNFKEFFDKINKYIDLSYLKVPDTSTKGELFKNQKIVMTGFRSLEISEFIEKNGGETSNSISKNTSLLICSDDTDESTSKYQKAKELKIKIMTKSEFINEYMKN